MTFCENYEQLVRQKALPKAVCYLGVVFSFITLRGELETQLWRSYIFCKLYICGGYLCSDPISTYYISTI